MSEGVLLENMFRPAGVFRLERMFGTGHLEQVCTENIHQSFRIRLDFRIQAL